MPDLVVGADGLARCAWAGSAVDYFTYHDEEWGKPAHSTNELYERLVLEGFQSGLSWLTILRKREAFRNAFSGFEPARVAAYDDADVARLMNDSGIVRNRAKILAAVTNARAVLALDVPLGELLWSFAPPPGRPLPRALSDIPAVTPESTAMARELKKRSFRFVGPTTAYALMQATGIVDDHLAGCWVRR